jgi:hypothetical protein
MSNNGLLIFHQGWTDIINCLPLVTYFQKIYQRLLVFHKQEAFDLFQYYCSQYPTLQLIQVPNDFEQEKRLIEHSVKYFKESFFIDIGDFNIIGVHDIFRDDQYKGVFMQKKDYFSVKFYTAYDIPHSVRLDSFSHPHNEQLEKEFFHRHSPNEPYILVHDTDTNKISLPETHSRKVQLQGLSSRFFDARLLLENASEIHVIDSVWAAVCYSLDGKYRCLSHIPIYVYCQRGHSELFTKPVHLPNWTIV